MFLITNKYPNLDLSDIPHVTDVWCSYLSTKTIDIHLSCEEGDEQIVFDGLPKWVHDEMKVTKSHTHIFLQSKDKNDMKPSTFTMKPFGSTLQKSEYETIARNIMAILQRTGDTFRELTWEEYKSERLKDENFTDGEKKYFDEVCYLSNADKDSILRFSPTWRTAYEQSK